MKLGSLLALASAFALFGSGCGSSDAPCHWGDDIDPVIVGSFEATSIPFADARGVSICINEMCDQTTASRVDLYVVRPAAENPEFGSTSNAPPKRIKVTVRFPTNVRSSFQLRTGDILRLRYPERSSGPWPFDMSFRANVKPAERCIPSTGTFEVIESGAP